jgi:hypothetical protein
LGKDWFVFLMRLIEKTYAVVVAIERYANLGDSWNLPDVTRQAARFAGWLIRDRGLSPLNLQIFLAGGDTQPFTDIGIPVGQIAEAESRSINSFLARLGTHWPEGELLLIYWVGHGFVARDGGRRLVLGDAEPSLKTNLDIDQLVRLLRSNQAGSFLQQIAFIDTCASFFEELQSSTDLPKGGLPPLAPRQGIEQNFYFAASSGEYATKNIFGPQVLDLLQQLPAHEWPPDRRWLRNGIEQVFDRLTAELLAQQRPAWLEYRDGSDNKITRGVPPTLEDIQFLSRRAGFPVYQLRALAQLAANCQKLGARTARDRLYASVKTNRPLNRPRESRDDLQLDLMRLIAGVIEQGGIQSLAAQIVQMESNSDEAFLFERAACSVEAIRSFWPLLAAIKLPLARAQILRKAADSLGTEQDPGSLEEIVDSLLDRNSLEPLIGFLLRASRERLEDPNCRALHDWLDRQVEWAAVLKKLGALLQEESKATVYLLVEIGEKLGAWRVTRSWLWSALAAIPAETEHLDAIGDLASDIAALLDEAQSQSGRTVHLEVLAPEELLHLERGFLAWENRGQRLDPEHLYPVTLRWRDRMAAPARDVEFQSGLWKKTGTIIRQRLSSRRRTYWIERDYELAKLRKQFDDGDAGELIGIPLSSDGELRNVLIGLICNAGLPYACWPRCSTVDVRDAASSLEQLLVQHQFDELPGALRGCRVSKTHPLGDILLLWDDPSRNPYDRKFSDVIQKG